MFNIFTFWTACSIWIIIKFEIIFVPLCEFFKCERALRSNIWKGAIWLWSWTVSCMIKIGTLNKGISSIFSARPNFRFPPHSSVRCNTHVSIHWPFFPFIYRMCRQLNIKYYTSDQSIDFYNIMDRELLICILAIYP